MQLGDTLKHSSILIYSTSKQSINTQNGWHKEMLIKKVAVSCGELMWHCYKNLSMKLNSEAKMKQ
jgi:hypothetical protein